ncbi:hypothetical protein CS063_16765 [Sporanaerobium hydrogeniformans]|uniref:Uncharacterized protein n=1 Tax=Sporanaerobium hydrogeniformans TaxID=3072179 RepID=A0AC61D991_9FIRM|nr:histidine kinase [Sporanaerobium hydrogeniformans]PHV69261.1 hypothetical protein CS063_16765 [Sporanaerobium hydrogeniformans]
MYQKIFHTLKGKIIACFFILIVICVSLSGIISYQYMAWQLRENSLDYSETLVTKINDSINYVIEDLDTLSKVIIINPHTMLLLGQETSTLDSNSSYLLAKDYIDSLTSFNPNILGLFITDLKEQHYSFGFNSNFLPRYDIQNESWFKAFWESDSMTYLVSPYETNSYMPSEMLSFVRKIKSLDQKEPIGLIKIDIKANFFKEIGTINALHNHNMVVLDRTNVPIYYSNPSKYKTNHTAFLKATSNLQGYFHLKENQESEIITYKKSPYSGLTVVLTISEKDLLSGLPHLSQRMFNSVLVCIFIGVLLALFISKSLSQAVARLAKGMQSVEKGAFDTIVVPTTHDEIGYLTTCFNQMTSRINELLHLNNEITNKNIKAELKVLQSQMNPHFLYNTLESIRMKAIANKPEDVSYLIEELGELLQFTLRHTSDFVSLETELFYLEKYINLHNIRLRHKIAYHFPKGPLLKELKIPKFILQPLIENAIIHGLEPIEERFISITVMQDGDKIIITLYNNGVPMKSKQVAALNALFEKNASTDTQHIGLSNVNNRLKLLYGMDYGLFIPYDATGTTIQLLLNIHLPPQLYSTS